MLYFGRTLSVFILLSVLLLTGCGVRGLGGEQDNSSQSQEGILTSRISNRWNALIKRDFAGAYEYNSPGYRELYTVGQYKAGFGRQVGWLDYKVENVVIEGSSAKVVVSVKYKALVPFQVGAESSFATGETAINENWIIDGGVWYYVPR